jgi:hypothetical protein
MDGSTTMSDIRKTYRTPMRILVPKLIKSRDAWKAKSDRRKAELRTAKVTIRDVTASRDRWRPIAEQAQTHAEENVRLREQIARVEQERDAAIAALDESKKK